MRARAGAVIIAAMLLGASPAQAAGFVVTTTLDTPDAVPGDGICADEAGQCSLRAAIAEANLSPDQDTVSLGGGTYVLNLIGAQEDGNLTGDLDLLNPIIISGAGPDSTVIQASSGDRLIHIVGTTATLDGLTLAGGHAHDGGAVLVEDGADVTIHNSVIEDNRGFFGGGIAVIDASLMVINSAIRDNDNISGPGGGLVNQGGTLIIRGSQVSDNRAIQDHGGGIANLYGSLFVFDTLISGNFSYDEAGGRGGGIYNGWGTVTIEGGEVGGNSAHHMGGGLYNGAGRLDVANVFIHDNEVDGLGGGVASRWGSTQVSGGMITNNYARSSGGGLYTAYGDTILSGTSLVGNRAYYIGGGVYVGRDGLVEISGAVLRGNSAGTYGSGIYSRRGTYSITGSCIAGHGLSAVTNSNRNVVQTATGNWWGSPDGPGWTGPGSGDGVSRGVDFSGFLTQAPAICAH